jgi:hypothetical protein
MLLLVVAAVPRRTNFAVLDYLLRSDKASPGRPCPTPSSPVIRTDALHLHGANNSGLVHVPTTI